MAVNASQLRANIYRLLDQVLQSGIPLEIERKGQRLFIVPERPRSKLDNLVERPDLIRGDPEDLVHVDWTDAWNPDACT